MVIELPVGRADRPRIDSSVAYRRRCAREEGNDEIAKKGLAVCLLAAMFGIGSAPSTLVAQKKLFFTVREVWRRDLASGSTSSPHCRVGKRGCSRGRSLRYWASSP